MGLTPTMRFFGTSINDEFGDVEESGILIEIDQILEDKRARHIESYIKSNPSKRFLINLKRKITSSRRKIKVVEPNSMTEVIEKRGILNTKRKK